MHKNILQLEAVTDAINANRFRAIFNTKRGRVLFLSLEAHGSDCAITDCFYIDRNQGRSGPARYSSKPKKLQTFQFQTGDLLSVIEAELDRQFQTIEFTQTAQSGLPLDEYIRTWSEKAHQKYRFLIMGGDGDSYNGLPVRLRTRLKNKLHRSIFVDLAYYKDGKGVVKRCSYYDRKYKRQGVQITPPTLISCFFPYTHEGILNLFNHEICCDFTHILVTEGIDLDSNTTPLCGAL